MRQTYIEDYDIDLGEWLGSDLKTPFLEGATKGMADIATRALAEQELTADEGPVAVFGRTGAAAGGMGLLSAAGIDTRGDAWRMKGWDNPELSPDQANAAFGAVGLKFAKPVRRQVAELLADQKRRQAERDSINERWRRDAGFWRGAGSLAATLAGSMLDPLNVLSAFVPVVGEARFAALAGSIGKGAALGAKGAAEGAAGAAMVEPLILAGAQARGQDYGLGDSFANIAIGGVLGGGLHLASHGAGRAIDAGAETYGVWAERNWRGKAARVVDRLAPEATPDQRETLLAMAIAQMQNGRKVDVATYAEAEGMLIRAADRDAVAEFDALFGQAMEDAARPPALDERRTLADAPSSRWRAGDAGPDGRFAAYDPLRPADAKWLDGEVYALENAHSGYRIFREVDGQGGTPDVIGQKSEAPDWFQDTNRQAKRNASFRRRKGEAAAEGLRTRGITKAEVRKVTDKLLARQPLTRAEADTAELLMDVARGRRAEDAGQRLAERQRRREAWGQYLDDFARREGDGDDGALSAVERLASPEKVARGALAEPEWGDFGPIFRERDLKAAVERLTREQDGEVPGALHHPETGPIDLVWGKEGTGESNGHGLAKIARWHPEVMGDLQGPLDAMAVKSRSPNRIILESATHRAVVRLDANAKAKTWLLTEFEKMEPAGGGKRTDIPPGDGKDGSPSPGRTEPAAAGRTTDIAGDAADADGMTHSPAADGQADNLPLIREPRNKPPGPGPAAREAMDALAEADGRFAPFLEDDAARAGLDLADAMARAAEAESMAADTAAVCIIGGL